MKRCLVWLFASMLVPAHAAEIGVHYATRFPSEDYDLALTSVRMGVELPWHWTLNSNWVLRTRVELALARINGEGNSATLAGIGPSLRLEPSSGRWYFDLGVRPGYLEEASYGDLDLGGQFQFESSLGVGYRLSEFLSVNYELVHISNGGFDDPNPGWNGHRLGLNFDF
ncbi:MAG: acyloxyacyl hydrolase [Pseudomonadota bacterium]